MYKVTLFDWLVVLMSIILSIMICLVPIVSFSPMVSASATGNLQINSIDFGNVVVATGDSVMVPVREVSEALGYNVTWLQETSSVQLSRNGKFVSFIPGQDSYTVGSLHKTLGKASYISNGTTYVPKEFLEQMLDLKCAWDGITLTITGHIVGEIEELTSSYIVITDNHCGLIKVYLNEATTITKDTLPVSLDSLWRTQKLAIKYDNVRQEGSQWIADGINFEMNTDAIETGFQIPTSAIMTNGVVTNVDVANNSISLTLADGDSADLRFTTNTKIRNLGFNASILNIVNGQRFAVMYSVSANGGFYEAFEISYIG